MSVDLREWYRYLKQVTRQWTGDMGARTGLSYQESFRGELFKRVQYRMRERPSVSASRRVAGRRVPSCIRPLRMALRIAW